MPSPPRDQSCMIIDFACWLWLASSEASRAQLSIVFRMMPARAVRGAASLVDGASGSRDVTSRVDVGLYCEPPVGSMPVLGAVPGAWPGQVLMPPTDGLFRRRVGMAMDLAP